MRLRSTSAPVLFSILACSAALGQEPLLTDGVVATALFAPWTQPAYVEADGDRALVALFELGTDGKDQLPVIFERNVLGEFVPVASLVHPFPPGAAADGSRIALQGDYAAVARLTAGPLFSGLVHVYRRASSGVWVYEDELAPRAVGTGAGWFGSSLAIDGELLALTSRSYASGVPQPVVELFERQPGGDWGRVAVLHAPVPLDTGSFGDFLAIDRDTVVASVSQYVANEIVFFVFERDAGGQWQATELDRIVDANWGADLVADDGRIAVGDPGPSLNPTPGEIRIFERLPGGGWGLTATLSGGPKESLFGSSFDLEGDRLATRVGLGFAQVARKVRVLRASESGAWFEAADLEADHAAAFESLGTPIALAGDQLLTGSQLQLDRRQLVVATLGGLYHGQREVGLAAGGEQRLSLALGPDRADAFFALLGSTSGTDPGQPLSGALTLPLVFDAYTVATLDGRGPLTVAVGFTDSNGRAESGLRVPPGSPPALAGTTLHHAALIVDLTGPTPTVAAVTNAVACQLLP